MDIDMDKFRGNLMNHRLRFAHMFGDVLVDEFEEWRAAACKFRFVRLFVPDNP